MPSDDGDKMSQRSNFTSYTHPTAYGRDPNVPLGDSGARSAPKSAPSEGQPPSQVPAAEPGRSPVMAARQLRSDVRVMRAFRAAFAEDDGGDAGDE